MKNFAAILVTIFMFSCQVLDKTEFELSKTFCHKCEKPLKEMLLKDDAIYVVKYNGNKLFMNYDAAKLDLDSLQNELMRKGFLPRKDSIVMYPVCCSKEKLDVKKEEANNLEDDTILPDSLGQRL